MPWPRAANRTWIRDFLDYRKQIRYPVTVGEPITPTDRQEIDAALLARLLLGALSEHEQRLLAVRLLKRDAAFRGALADTLEPFEMFDLDLLAEYSRLLRRGGTRQRRDLEEGRQRLLARAFERADLDDMLRNFTYSDVLQLGEVTRKLFSWSMAEMLIGRTRRPDLAEYEALTSLYLALMVIDVVEILGAAGHSPEFPEVIEDVRRRIAEASSSLEKMRSSPGGAVA